MSLGSGSRLGPYEVVAPLGAGGMGEVYRARDTRLDRTVAIKVLPSALAADPQLRDRFDREARAISSLSHPHICALFDVGHENGIDYLVLEYLEGETVADRLARVGALETSDALKIAVEVCDALDKAHRSGIVHRDLKPANVMLTKAGAKLVDFGLAKNAAPTLQAASASMVPTTPPSLTSPGTILGTFQYMAPEQIEGFEADARTDIFAFGALLFEMITGRPAFEGKTRASLLGAVLKDTPPPVSTVRAVIPTALDRIVTTCLEKDPDDRYQSARDLLRDLKWAASGGAGSVAEPRTAPLATSSRLAWLVAAVAVVGLIAAGIVALRRATDAPPAANPVQFTIMPPDEASFGGPTAGGTGTATQVAISRDGRNIVFVAGSQQQSYRLWLRPLDVQVATPIPGTDAATFPFWSPDGRFIAFFADGKLKKVALSGGPPIVLCDAPAGRGGSWSADNVILFSPAITAGTHLMRVPAAGGTPVPATTIDAADGETNHRWPHFLPDARHFIYTASTGACCPPAKPSTIRIGSLDPAEDHLTLFEVESSVSYAVGHLLFARDESLMAQPFDPESRRATGEAFPIAGQVGPEGSRYVSVSASENGTLIYAPDSSRLPRQLTWFDRAGRVTGTVAEALQYSNPALSPDGKRVALALGGGDPRNQQGNTLRTDIWLIDLDRNVRSPLTVDPGMDRAPVWSPDGARIAFSGVREGKITLRQKAVDSAASDELLLESPEGSSTSPTAIGLPTISPTDWSADGQFIAYTLVRTFPQRSDVWVLPLGGDRKPIAVADTVFLETAAVFSPDGRWIAYVSTEAGQPNVYVQPFPPRDTGRRRVSTDGGGQPAWRADGKELFFVRGDGTMMVAAVNTAGEIDVGVPRPLFHALHPSSLTLFVSQYSVTNDGARFLVNIRPQRSEMTPLTVITNWTAAIRR